MKKTLFAFFAGAILLAACATAPKTAQQINDEYTGAFAGVIPCADCAGVDTELTLNRDGTYKLSETYLNEEAQTFVSGGTWRPGTDFKSVELTDSKTKDKSYYAFNGKDALKKLDVNANPINSKLNYVLKRRPVDFSAVQDKEWRLSQVKDAGGQVTFDTVNQTSEFLKGIFTLQFDEGRAFGKASPNRYTAPYTLGAGNKITFGLAASTMMMGLVEPVGLNEHGYFILLSKVSAWNVVNNQLVLYTVNDDGEKITMLFK